MDRVDTGGVVRVLTWNVLYRDREARLPALLTHLRRANADILMLQETSDAHARTVADDLGMDVLAIAGNAGDVNVPAILSRWPAAHTSAHRVVPSRPEHAVIADVSTPSGVLRVICAHLRATRSAWRMTVAAHQDDPDVVETVSGRIEQLRAISDVRSALPRCDAEVFGGDLNAVPDGPEYGLIRAWGVLDAVGASREPTILAANPLVADAAAEHPVDYTLDFQFHSPTLTPVSWSLVGMPSGGQWPSDHLGVLVDYERAP